MGPQSQIKITTVVTFKQLRLCTSLWPCIFMFGDHLDLLLIIFTSTSDSARALGAILSV